MPEKTSAGLADLLSRRFIALLIVSFFLSFISAPRNELLPVYVDSELHRAPLFSGILRSFFLILGGIFAVPAGMLCDAIGIKRVIVLGIAGPLLSGFIFLTGDPFLLSALCIGIGVSFGFNSTGGQSYLLGAVPPSVIGIASAGYFLGSTLGSASGNLIAGPVVDAFGFRPLGLAACAAAVLLAFATALFMPALPRENVPSAQKPFSLSGSLGLLRRREVRLLMGIRYLPTCYWGAVTLLVPLLIYRVTGTKSSAAYYGSISLTIAAGFQVLTGRLCDRIGRWRPILISASCVTLSAVGLALTGHTLTGLYAFGVMAAASAWSLSTTMPGLLQLIGREGEKGRIVGMAHLVWSAGMLTGNLGAGKLIEWGPALPFGIAVVFCLGAVACGWGLYRIYRSGDGPAVD